MQADVIFINADIITMDKQKPRAQAVAVKDGNITAVGAREEIESFADRETKIVDLKGKAVVPGLTDAHTHMISLTHPFQMVNLRGVSSIKEIQQRLRVKVNETEKGKWILGRGWDQDRLKEKRCPTRWDLDKVSPDNPVLLRRVCGHMGVANSKALEIAKIAQKDASSLRSLIDKDPNTGEPTGILREEADEMLWNLPEPNDEELRKACSSACLEAAKAGLTSVHWLVNKPNEVYALQRLNDDNQLLIRVNIIIPIELLDNFKDKSFSGPNLRLKCVKIFTDGSLGARTAALQEPYEDEPSTRGILYHELNELKKLVKTVDRAGFQIAVHAIGDLAIEQTLDAFEQSLSKPSIRRNRHRIEHVSVLNPKLINRIRRLGLATSIQPHFVVSDFWVVKRLGSERARWTYPFKSILEHGIVAAGSSDAPVEPLSPLLGVWAAVARESYPEERMSVHAALEAYTTNAAYLSFEENVKGSIEVGKFADMTVLSRNPLDVQPEKIRDIQVEATIVGGRIVYSAID